ncbi:unnamed protein product [Phyllotreta striolata]|uniref:Uncharacterized protein n=1 Tax=Phyllotreta striolata TaxID=444603 RepID=A0A9N9XMJ5_PHYSR|nr:unnamed protein product [Phyllotreta striolata]
MIIFIHQPRVFIKQRPNDRIPIPSVLIEQRIQNRQMLVPRFNSRSYDLLDVITKQIRFPSLRVLVSMPSVKRQPNTSLKRPTTNVNTDLHLKNPAHLVPPLQQLRFRIVEEPADVGAAEHHAHYVGEHALRVAGTQVRPIGCVVSRPHGRVPLGPSEMGTGQNEGSFGVVSVHETLMVIIT